MNNPHILICIEKPIHYIDDSEKIDGFAPWLDFLKELPKSGLQFSKDERPIENTFLIPLSSGLLRATRLLATLERNKIPHRSFLIPEDPIPCV